MNAFWKGLTCLALAAPVGHNALANDSPQTGNVSSTDAEGLNEIVVTARKRTENLQDVPEAISVISANTMVEQGAVSLQDYYATVPGLSVVDQGNGQLSITMRGLSSGGVNGVTNPTVAVTIDDVPIGASDTAIILGANFVPQLDPADLQRIEFLKGPQGTLYGASSLGGVMRYVTLDPDFSGTTGRVEVDGSGVDGAGLGYGVRGNVNIPLISDTLAVRLSAFDRRDPGFVDDPLHNLRNVNSSDTYGIHAAALLQFNPALTLRLAALYQRTEGNGEGTVDTTYRYQPSAGDLNHDRLPGTGATDHATQLYSASLNFNSKLLDITSITGYSLVKVSEDFDESLFLAPSPEQIFGVQGAALINLLDSHKFTEEVRVSAPSGSRLEWQVGGFFTAEDNYFNFGRYTANDPTTGALVGSLATYLYPTTYTEYDGFANLTYHFTEMFNIQVGGRESYNRQKYSEDFYGPFIGPEPSILSTRSSDRSFTYLVTPQLRLSDALMTYVRIASGYQAGGPNSPSTPTSPVPLTFAPSTTVNYEVGLKTFLFDQRLSIDANVFYINWTSIQLEGISPQGASFVFNGGKAKSQGVEIASEFRPLKGLTLSGSVSYTDAILTSDAGNGFPGVAGDPLPFSSKYSGSLSADDRFRITATLEGFVGATAAYVGARYETFPRDFGEPEPRVPAYAYLNLRSGFAIEGYTVTAFLKNATNERGVLSTLQQSGGTATSGVWYTAFIQPRTVGLSISKEF